MITAWLRQNWNGISLGRDPNLGYGTFKHGIFQILNFFQTIYEMNKYDPCTINKKDPILFELLHLFPKGNSNISGIYSEASDTQYFLLLL